MLSRTELSQKSADLAEMRPGPLGRCSHFFWLGVAFDAVGVAVLFTGVFANLLFYDMLLYLGSIIIFVSLLWWISWYTGNIEAFPEDLLRGTSPRDGGVHRDSSRRFSLTLRSVSDTFQRIHRRRRRRRLHPRVLQRICSISTTDSSQLERNRDARTGGGRASFGLAKPKSVKNHFGAVQASKSLPLVPIHTPLSICTSRSQPAFSVTSQSYPLTSDSNSRMFLSSDTHVSHSQQRSKISVASRSYPLDRAESQSHLLVPVSSESFSMTSQSDLQSSDSYLAVSVDHHALEHSKISVTSQSYPLKQTESQSHLVIADTLSMIPMTSQSLLQFSASSESQVPVDPHSQERSKISVTSQSYPLEQAESQSHLVIADTLSMIPMTSQSLLQFSASSESQVPVDLHSQERSKISVTSQSYPLERAESQSHLVIADTLSMIPMTSQSLLQFSASSESQVPVDLHSQERSKISVTSQSYPLEQAESQSHLPVPVPSDSFSMIPMTSQSKIQGSLAQQIHLQNIPFASQTPETDKASKSHTLAKGAPVVSPGFAQTQHPQASLAQTSQSPSSSVQKVPKN